jgi:hypothetical protein
MTDYIFLTLNVACCGFAFHRGAAPERMVAISIVLAIIATLLADMSFPVPPGALRVGVFCVDCIMLASLIAVALWANRFWPMLVAAMQANAVFAHVAVLFAPATSPWAYVAAIAASGFLIPPVLAYGTFAHDRRRQRGGDEPAWSQFS